MTVYPPRTIAADFAGAGRKLCIDLCSGKEGFSSAFKLDPNWEVVTVDIVKKFRPTICADVRYLPIKPGLQPDALLMSPPCNRWSIANPKWPLPGIQLACEIVGACLEAVATLKPKKWIMENPRGRLRWIIGDPRHVIRYSDYDFSYPLQKATDFWGNVSLPMVKGVRRPPVGHLPKGWFNPKAGNRQLFPTSADRAKIPLAVSMAVKQGVEASA